MILLPPTLSEYCATTQCTPFELLATVQEMSANGDTGLTFENSDVLLNWCAAACHVDSGKSKLAYALEIAHDNSPTFQAWCATRLTATLGPRDQIAATPPPRSRPTQQLLPSGAGDGAPPLVTGVSYRGDEAGNTYDKFQYAVIQGFSHCHDIAGLQHIWGLFAQTKSFDTHRLTRKESMITWARRFNVTINRGVFFSKQAIDNFINLRFNPSGGVVYFQTAEKGMSILLCRSRAGNEREQATAHELAEGASSTNRTLAEALALNKRDPRPPPDTYQDLKAVIGTFCAVRIFSEMP